MTLPAATVRILALFGALAMAGGGHAVIAAEANTAPSAAAVVAPRVTVAVAMRREVVETVMMTGTLVAREDVLVGPEIDGAAHH